VRTTSSSIIAMCAADLRTTGRLRKRPASSPSAQSVTAFSAMEAAFRFPKGFNQLPEVELMTSASAHG
jgi:hypothetical protein